MKYLAAILFMHKFYVSHAATSELYWTKGDKIDKGVLEVSSCCKSFFFFVNGVCINLNKEQNLGINSISVRLFLLSSVFLSLFLVLSISSLLFHFQSVTLSSLSLCSVPPPSLPLQAHSESGATLTYPTRMLRLWVLFLCVSTYACCVFLTAALVCKMHTNTHM